MARVAQSKPAAPAIAGSDIPRGARFVTVASKLPMSIEIQLCEPRTAAVTGQFGSVKETINVKTGAVYVIRGTGYPVGQPPKGYPKLPDSVEESGYTLTPNIPADWFAEWLRQNAETDMVRNKLVMASGDRDRLADETIEHAKTDSGLGPLNPEGDKRDPKPMNSSMTGVTTEVRGKAA